MSVKTFILCDIPHTHF